MRLWPEKRKYLEFVPGLVWSLDTALLYRLLCALLKVMEQRIRAKYKTYFRSLLPLQTWPLDGAFLLPEV